MHKLTQEGWRALTDDELEIRRAELTALTEDPGEEDAGEIVAETRALVGEYERRKRLGELRSLKVEEVKSGAGKLVEHRSFGAEPGAPEFDAHDTPEYRRAFMNYCQRGIEFRADDLGTIITGPTLSTGVTPQIPTTMQQQIVQKMESYGTIWNEVTKISVKGGIWFRVLDIEPTAAWLQENNVSEYQGVTNDAKISFSFFELECRMSQSLLAGAVTYDDFQAMFVPAVARAMTKAIEQAIMRGDGTTKPLGILNDPRVSTLGDHDPRTVAVVEMTAAEFGAWKKWRTNFKAKIPSAYRSGKLYMAYSTFDSYIETMSDDMNAPVSIGYNPVTGVEEARLCGFSVTRVEPDILPDFDAAAGGDVVAIYGDMSKYYVNTQPGMPLSTVRWVDHDTNTEKMKSLVALDGKVLDPYGFILIKKKSE